MSLKAVIKIDDEVKPFSRNYIAEKVVEIQLNLLNGKTIFTEVENDELDFYKQEFDYEINQILKTFTYKFDEEMNYPAASGRGI